MNTEVFETCLTASIKNVVIFLKFISSLLILRSFENLKIRAEKNRNRLTKGKAISQKTLQSKYISVYWCLNKNTPSLRHGKSTLPGGRTTISTGSTRPLPPLPRPFLMKKEMFPAGHDNKYFK